MGPWVGFTFLRIRLGTEKWEEVVRLDQSLGPASVSTLGSLQSARSYSHVIRLLMPLSIDKGELLPNHFR